MKDNNLVIENSYIFKSDIKFINNSELLKKRILEIPNLPGCYLFRDIDGNLLYVGKSKSLRSRINSYFNNYSELSPRLSLMVRQITEIEIIITDNENEALNLESNLIKANKPYFNILLKDDKKYPYLCITWSEEYPRIFITRKRRNRRNLDRYYGPYVDVGLLRKTLFIIKKYFPLKQSKLSKSFYREITGVDLEKISSEDYRQIIKQVSMIFQGRNEDLVKILENKMSYYSKELQYENAAKIRDQILGIKLLNESQKISIPDSTINRDIFGIISKDNISSIQIFQMRSGKLVGRIGYSQEMNDFSEHEILQKVLEEHYINVDKVEIPNEILIQFELSNKNILEQWLSDRKNKKVKIKSPKRNKKLKTIELVIKNAKLELDRLLNDFEENQIALEDLTNILDLTITPRRIEGYDISHIQGSDPVASQVVFINGIPAKHNYRKYKINNSNVFIGHSDDFSSIAEVIFRRFKKWSRFKREGGDFMTLIEKNNSRLDNELFSDWPDLVIIDGGKGQLNSAIKALKSLDLFEEVNVCSLAKKNEEIFIPGNNKPLKTDKNQKGIMLIRRVRDEAHRFALSFHRNKRTNRMKRSQLSEITGIGTSKIKDLLQHFKSLEAIRLASINDLLKVKGLGETKAKNIYNYFHDI
tara:strand:- start:1895 stop:3826 length:1932 start_codon:yes stop_codon:yes gene_type:complete